MDPLPSALYDLLAGLETSDHTIDQRSYHQRKGLSRYRELAALGFCKEDETGPGGSVAIFSITPEGVAALDAHRSS
jgi:hypothetical protein